MPWKSLLRRALWFGAALIVFELAYLVGANALLRSGAVERVAGQYNPLVICELGWDSAWSPYPGRVYVEGLTLRLQDPVLEFQLTAESARLDIVLWELARKKFRASHAQAVGVTYRLVTRLETISGREARVAAFAPIDGFARPALLANPAPLPLSEDEVDDLWEVELNDVDAALSELWLFEFRYRGPARAEGAFNFAPLRKLAVRDTTIQFNGGTLTVGESLISNYFTARAAVDLAPPDLPGSPGLSVIRTLVASIQFDTLLHDVGVAGLYVEGLRTRGSGWLTGDLRVAGGRVLAGSSVEAWFPSIDALYQGIAFNGVAHARLSMPEGADAPAVRAALGGNMNLPFLVKGGIGVKLTGVTADLSLVDDLLSSQPTLRRVSVVLAEAKVKDARPLTALVGTLVPIFTPMVLGEGPLTASATAWVTPEYTLVRLKSLKLGDAEFEGAAVPGKLGWNGAAAGHFGAVPLGLRLKNKAVTSVLFTPPSWLGEALIDAGIKPDPIIVGQR